MKVSRAGKLSGRYDNTLPYTAPRVPICEARHTSQPLIMSAMACGRRAGAATVRDILAARRA